MGIILWLKKMSYEKSASNIIEDLQPLVTAVREDLDGATSNLNHIAKLGEPVEQVTELSETEVMEAMETWRRRKGKVVKAQKKLYNDITMWSSFPPERSFNEVILPVLLSGQLVAPSEPYFDPVIVAVYRVCEIAAKQNGVNLEAYTPPQILEKVKDAGDLYKTI